MTTLARAGSGLVIGGAALALTLVAGGILWQAWQAGPGAPADVRTPKERSYAVGVATLTAETVTPEITSYGRLVSAHVLELRAAAAGTLVELAPTFRDGGKVAAGDVLYRIDPSKLETALALAEADVAEAEAELTEARAALELAKLEEAAAQEQFDLRDAAVTRAQDLRDRGTATAADVESAVLARAAAQQTFINRRSVVAGDEARLAQGEITLTRRQIAREDAARTLEASTVTAPFAGVLASVTAVPGGQVSANEQLGVLMDPGALEVAFRVTSNQFSRLLNANGDLRKADVGVLVQRGRDVTELGAKLDRAAAEIDEDKVGRLVYATLTEPDPTMVQPGDFVTLRIPERPLDNVAEIPAAAVTSDGRLLLIGPENRLEEVQATLLRHQGDSVIVADVPFGRDYVTARALQLGAGIQVTPMAPRPEGEAAVAEAPAEAAEAAPTTMALDDDRRAAIVAFIEASTTMKPEMKEKWLAELALPEVPIATVEKFEAKMAEGQ